MAADRAAASFGTVSNGSCPAVSAGPAHPAHLLQRPGQDLFRSQRLIPLIVPFFSQRWVDSGQAVFLAGQPANTIGTATAIHPGVRRSLPLMPLLTAPPNLLPAGGGNLPRGERGVFLWMPLLSQIGTDRGKAVLRRHPPAGAVGAVLTTDTALIDLRFPFMSPFTAPPDVF